jgi:hypothetical protein
VSRLSVPTYAAPWRNAAITDAGSAPYTIDFSPWGGVQMKTAGSPLISYQFVCMTAAQFTAATGAAGPRDGRAVSRFTVHSGDQYGSSSGERVEVISPNPPAYFEEASGTESWWAWASYVPQGWTPTAGWNILLELHHDPGNAQPGCPATMSPNVSLSAFHTTYSFSVNGGTVAGDGSWPMAGRYQDNANVPLVIGAWQDFILYVRWDRDGTKSGRVILWTRNEATATDFTKRVDSLTMPDLVHGTGGGPILTMYQWSSADVPVYPLLGHYRNNDPSTQVVYHGSLYRAAILGGIFGAFNDSFTVPL